MLLFSPYHVCLQGKRGEANIKYTVLESYGHSFLLSTFIENQNVAGTLSGAKDRDQTKPPASQSLHLLWIIVSNQDAKYIVF
jgi:hypothetical protein